MTMVFNNSVFIHIPRTGGLWFREVCKKLDIIVLEGSCDKWHHCCHKELPKVIRSMPAFTFLRHPLDWVRSRWRHSLSIRAFTGYRFHGPHRRFDELVEDTLQGTINNILKRESGLVGKTYQEATEGVCTFFQTEELGKVPALLQRLEGIPVATSLQVVTDIPVYNRSAPWSFGVEAEKIDDTVVSEFLLSETVALDMWSKSCIVQLRPCV